MKLTREEARVILKVEVRLGRLKRLLIKARVGQCCRTCQCPGLLPVFFLGRSTAPWRGGAAGVPWADPPNLPVSWPASAAGDCLRFGLMFMEVLLSCILPPVPGCALCGACRPGAALLASSVPYAAEQTL